jgi:hypothetical protein
LDFWIWFKRSTLAILGDGPDTKYNFLIAGYFDFWICFNRRKPALFRDGPNTKHQIPFLDCSI